MIALQRLIMFALRLRITDVFGYYGEAGGFAAARFFFGYRVMLFLAAILPRIY